MLEISYIAEVLSSSLKHVAPEVVLPDIEKLKDDSADFATFLSDGCPSFISSGEGFRFEYSQELKQLKSVVSFKLKRKPSQQELDAFLPMVSELADRGYYGEDGWFVDLSEGSYYIQVVANGLASKSPCSVKVGGV